MDKTSNEPVKITEDQQPHTEIDHFKVEQNVLGSLKKFYLDSDSGDVKFTFGLNDNDGPAAEIAAHKILLAAGSDVFRAMFYGKLKETGDIHVTDASDAAFKEFLQYFYKNQFKLSAENIVEVMCLGQKYNVPKCIEDCTAFLKRAVNDENICTILLIGILYDQLELVKLCEKHVISYADAVFKTTAFLDCDRKVLEHILNMDFFCCAEVDVFEACMEWIKVKSKCDTLTKEIVQEYLGDLFYKIRFASMTMQQLCALQTKYKSVISNDFDTLTKIITNGPEFHPEKFVTASRQIKWNKDTIVKGDRRGIYIQAKFFYSNHYGNEIQFSSDEPLIFGGFLLSGRLDHGEDYDPDRYIEVVVNIFEMHCSDDEKILRSNIKKKLTSKETSIMLPQPIFIHPECFYSIEIGPFPSKQLFPGRMVKSKIQLESRATIKFHNKLVKGDDDKDIKGGLILGLDFNAF